MPRVARGNLRIGDRSSAAKPLPLQADTSPDTFSYAKGYRRGRPLGLREAKRTTATETDLAGPYTPTSPHVLGAHHRHRYDGNPSLQSKPSNPAVGMSERPRAYAGPLREDHDTVTTLENRASGGHRLFVPVSTIDGKGPQAVEQPSLPAMLEQLALCHVVDGPTRQRTDHERVEKAAVVGCEQDGPGAWNVLAPQAGKAKVEQEEWDQDGSRQPVENRVDAMSKRVLAKRVQLSGVHVCSTLTIHGSLRGSRWRVIPHGGQTDSSGTISPFVALLVPVGCP